jgi:AraC-like DNA-binding protein
MSIDCTITVEFFKPSPALEPYLTSFYLTETVCDPGVIVDDYLHPEWAAMRFTEGPPPIACVGSGEMVPQWPFVANGPTGQTVHFGVQTSRIWGLGLQPAGWSKFVDWEANKLANTTVDGTQHPAFALFAGLAHQIFDGKQDSAAEAARIDAYLMQHIDRPVAREAEILACQEALRDPEMASVGELCERLDLNARSLERLCNRYFGFSPKRLLKRQRFLRSLAQFMLDGDANWSDSLDAQYYDQSQFVRDFRSFMGMTPREYAEMPHPILKPIMRQRMADQGAADPLDLPTIARYSQGS